MTNMNVAKMVRSLIGKTLAVALFTGILTIASYAQSNKLFEQRGGAFFGTVTVFPGSHFQIETNGTVIKTFANSCKPTSSNGVPGLICTFGQFKDGRHIYSGEGQFFQNGIVFLRWTNDGVSGVWRQIDSGWIGYRP